MYVVCPGTCGRVLHSPAEGRTLTVEPGATVDINCSICGKQVIPPGFYDLRGGILDVLKGIPYEQYQLMREIADRRRSGELSADETVAELTAIEPRLQAFFAQARGNKTALLALLFTIIQAALAAAALTQGGGSTTNVTNNSTIDQTVIEQCVDEAIQKCVTGGPPKITVPTTPTHSRNADCWCGSGKKNKKCHDCAPPQGEADAAAGVTSAD